MPELPEVEITRLSIAEPLTGARIVQAVPGKALRWPLGCPPGMLVGRVIQQVRRRGKYLLLELDEGVLLIHLGMSGSLRLAPHPHGLGPPGPHEHFDLHTSQALLRLHDPRRFGAVVYAESLHTDPAAKLLHGLGLEPLDTPAEVAIERLWQGTRGRRTTIKAVLLAGELVVGVGNIYASEALFHARIHPSTPAGRVGHGRIERLHAAIVAVLRDAVALGGSTLKDFRSAEGKAGYFQLQAQVYGRAGKPCRVCATPIRQIVQGQRSTFYCPQCQH